MWLRCDKPGQKFKFMLFAGDPQYASPFVVRFKTPEKKTAWTRLEFAWDDFVQPQWADGGHLSRIDPARVISLAIILDRREDVVLWVDDIALYR